LAGCQSRLRLEADGLGLRRSRSERENENRDDCVVAAERQVLRAHAPQIPIRVGEDGFELGRLAALHGAAEQRRDLLSLFRRQRLGEMAAEQLGVRPPGGLLRCFVHVHEAALHVVQARGHHEAVDQPQVDVLQTVGHFTDMLNQSFTMRQQRHGRFNGLGDRSPYSATGCCPARSIP
jgi:hypothetical protein